MKNQNLAEPDAVRSLAALGLGQRLRAFRALVGAGPDGLTAGALAEALDISPSALSFHLKELVHADLASSEAQGRYQIYRANFAQMESLLAYLTEHCCQGAACGVRPKGRRRAVCAP
jgi:DNA-binding transcriptional ArsR family regulator